MRLKAAFSIVALAGLAVAASASVRFNEIQLNPPDADNGREFIELIGTPGFSLTGLTLLVIEGEGANKGIVDQALSLSSSSIGANGLFLWRDGPIVLDTNPTAGVQGPDAATTLKVQDFSPDIENGSNTFIIVSGWTGSVGNDIDTNNDGDVDNFLWSSVQDAVSFIDDDDTGTLGNYASELGGTDLGQVGGLGGWSPDLLFRSGSSWFAADTLTTDSFFFTFDPAESTYGLGYATPGVANIPAPAAMSLFGLAAVAGLRRRR